jgi:hypothetical protein
VDCPAYELAFAPQAHTARFSAYCLRQYGLWPSAIGCANTRAGFVVHDNDLVKIAFAKVIFVQKIAFAKVFSKSIQICPQMKL